MKSFIWKLRCAFELRRLLKLSLVTCWMIAGIHLDEMKGDTSECPIAVARWEYEEWLACC